MTINEGAKIIIYNLSHDSHSGIITANSTFELNPNTLMLNNGYLCNVEFIEINKNGITVIKVYEQDAVVVNGNYLYKTTSDCY